ncbi:MAG: hypothetical protein HKM02_07375 [Pseudomonadales bacterium]|nr:hypothetical protein [Pseudomonadales bacterium]
MHQDDRESTASQLLQASDALLQPWLLLLLDRGVDYAMFSKHLKSTFLKSAQALLADKQQKATDSALSILSGVHRKDVRLWRETQTPSPSGGNHASLANQVWTRWLHDERYQGDRLPRQGAMPSFETLVREISQDIHPHSVLQELKRLGLVDVIPDEVDWVCRQRDSFVPPQDTAEVWAMLAGSLGDHIQAAVDNIRCGPTHLEQSVFAEPLSEASMVELEQVARESWSATQQRLLTAASRLWQRDQCLPATDRQRRFRAGAYYYQGTIKTSEGLDDLTETGK